MPIECHHAFSVMPILLAKRVTARLIRGGMHHKTPGFFLNLFFVLVFIAASESNANAAPGVITLNDWKANNSELFAERALVLRSVGSSLSDEEAHQQLSRFISGGGPSNWRSFKELPPQNYSSQVTLWAGVRIINNGQEPQYLYYRNTHTTIREATLYLWWSTGSKNVIDFGDLHELPEGLVRYHQFTFPVKLLPGESVDLLLKIPEAFFLHDSVVRSHLLTQAELALDENVLVVVAWYIVGALSLLVFLCLFAAIGLKSGMFGWLVVTALTAILMQLDFMGYCETYLWPSSIFLKTKSMILLVYVMHISTTIFTYNYLRLNKVSLRICWPLYLVASLLSIVCFIALVSDKNYSLLLIINSAVSEILMLVLFVISCVLWRRGGVAARRMAVILFLYLVFALVIAFDLFSITRGHSLNMLLSNLIILILDLLLFMSALLEFRKVQIERDTALIESRAKSEFLARMSHEIRTPMNGVIGMTEILSKTPLSKIQTEHIEVIKQSGRTLLNVINSIMDFSKIGSGKMKLELVEVDILRTIEECVSLFASDSNKKGLELVCAIDYKMPFIWLCDELRVRQIIFNVLGNAVKFTQRGEIIVSVTALRNNAGCRITISDTGIGISPDQQDFLFDAFTQSDVSTSRKYGGTGLGLAICKQLIELMGGTITVSSELGKGASFCIELPLQPSGQQTHDKQVDPELSEKRVLIVDDHVVALRSLASRAELLGVEVASAQGGVQALELIRRAIDEGRPFDLVLCDIDMPLMNGYELAKKIHNLDSPPPIVLLSPTNDIPSDKHFKELGIVCASYKPISRQGLRWLILRGLGLEDIRFSIVRTTVLPDEILPIDGLNILVAEDNEINFQVVSAMLKQLGHHATRAHDGEEVVRRYMEDNLEDAGARFDLILMDCEMPNMNGFDATRRIRSLENQHGMQPIPIVALTAHVIDDMLLQCKEAGMDDYLSKPIQLKVLKEKLESVISVPDGKR